jgi:hypothetical protein
LLFVYGRCCKHEEVMHIYLKIMAKVITISATFFSISPSRTHYLPRNSLFAFLLQIININLPHKCSHTLVSVRTHVAMCGESEIKNEYINVKMQLIGLLSLVHVVAEQKRFLCVRTTRTKCECFM